jgi:hypothetical protein
VQLVLVASQEAKAHDLIEKMQRVRRFGQTDIPEWVAFYRLSILSDSVF